MKVRYVILTAALFVAPASAKTIKASYKCSDGTRLTASFHTPSQGLGSVTLYNRSSGKKTDLLQGPSADGGRYVSGKTQFWVKGNQATWTRKGKDVTCRTKT